MRNILLRDTLRSILRNKLRFISVAVIVALGISFYIGIKSASPKMGTTANDYFNEYNLFDVRVTSRIPFTDDDITKISELENVDSVVKSRSVDAIARIGTTAIVDNNGMELSCRVSELDSDAARRFSETGEADGSYVNRLKLVDGRYPEKAGECVIDSRAVKDYKEIKIGTVLTLSGDGASITDMLKSEEITIVGTVDSPVYISSDHGTTQVSAGSLSTFVYVDSQSFSTDDFNEVFIKVTDSNYKDKFVKSYDDEVTALAGQIQEMSSSIIDAKLVGIKTDYNEKIAAKQQEIDDYEKSSAEALEKKSKEIKDFKDYVNSEDSILEKEKKAAEAEKTASKSELDSVKSSFTKLNTEYEANVKKYDGGSQKIDGYTELKKLYDDLNSKHQNDKKTLDALESTKKSAQSKLESARDLSDKASSAVKSAENKISTLNSDIKSLKADIASLESEKVSLESGIVNLDSEIKDLNLKIEVIDAKVEDGTATLEDRTARSGYKSSLKIKQSDKTAAQNRLDEVKVQLSSKNSSLGKKNSELEKVNAELPSLKSELMSSQNAVSVAQTGYEGAKSNYDNTKKSYDADSATLAKYKKSMDDLTSGQTELLNLNKTIESQKKELDSIKVKLTVAQIRYSLAVRDGDKKILKAQEQLSDAKLRYDSIDNEYADLKKEIDQKFTDLNGDLKTLKNTLKNVESITWNASAQTQLSGHSSFISSMESINSMSMIFPLLFLFTAMVACFVIMLKNVEDERNSIGLFKAFGYNPLVITAKFLAYSTAAWLIGSIIGVILGVCVFPGAIYSIYGSIYNIPDIGIAFNPGYIVKGMFASLVTTTAASCIAVFKELRHYPAALMRPKAISYNRRSLVEYIPSLWTRLPYGIVILVRTISRSRKRVVVGTLAIGCCTALILSALGLLNSASDVKSAQYGQNGIFCYDMQMVLNAGQNNGDSVTLDSIENDNNIESGLLVCKIAYDVSAVPSRWRGFDSAHIVIPSDVELLDKYVNFNVVSGSQKPDGGKVVISEKMSLDLKVKTGDTVYFTDTNGGMYSAEVGGIVKNYIDHYVYMSPETYEETFRTAPEYKYILCRLKDYLTETEIASLSSKYLKTDEVTGVITSDELANSVDISINQVLALVILFVASACLLAAIVMYTIANVNISERTHEIANIKVIGFSDGEVLLYVIRENIVSTVVGALIGLVGGIFLHRALIDYISVGSVMYGNRIFWWSFLMTILIIAAVAVAAALPIMFKINRVDVPETLKSLE